MLYKGTQPICPIVTKQPVVETLTVTPSTTAQTLTPPSGTDGYNTVTVSAVTASIDSDIQAGNIKNGVNILGVTGNYSGITPTGTYTITANGTYDVTNYASANVNVSGGGGTKYGATGGTFLGDVDANGVLSYDSNTPTDLVFTGVRDLGDYALLLAFVRVTTISTISKAGVAGFSSIQSVSFPDLVNISGNHALRFAFTHCKNLASINFPKLETVTSTRTCYMAFGDTDLTTVSFPVLNTITGSYCLQNFFTDCQKLTTLSFPALTSTSFGSYTNQFNAMLSGVTGCTVHFPSNLQSVIGSWSSVTSGFSGTNTTVLFDLPATT